jgi:hypothetical protein
MATERANVSNDLIWQVTRTSSPVSANFVDGQFWKDRDMD